MNGLRTTQMGVVRVVLGVDVVVGVLVTVTMLALVAGGGTVVVVLVVTVVGAEVDEVVVAAAAEITPQASRVSEVRGGERASCCDEFRRAVGAHLQCGQVSAGGIAAVTRRLVHASGGVEVLDGLASAHLVRCRGKRGDH